MIQRSFKYLLLVLLMLAASVAYGQQTVPPGTSVDNQAQGRHLLSANGDSVFVNSNTVSAIVQAVGNISLVPNQHTRTRAGQLKTFTHRLSSTGNIPVTVTVTAANIEGDDYDLINLNLAEVSGGQTGKASTNTAAAAPSDSLMVTLQPGEEFVFEVNTQVPNEARAGQLGTVLIEATTDDGTVVLQNNDVVEVLEGPAISVEKAEVTGNTTQGERLSYRISGENTGDQGARPFNITIDGQRQTKVLLRDRIPANTTFAEVENDGRGIPLYHTIGSPDRAYTTEVPDDRSRIDEFAVALDSLAPGGQVQVQFAVTIHSNAAGQIDNVARMEYRDPIDDEEQVTEANTNSVQTKLPEHDASINYYRDDSFNNRRTATGLGTPLFLQADGAACNMNAARADTVIIMVASQQTGDEENFEAVETGPNTGFFRVLPGVPTRNANEFEVVTGNAIIETVGNDVLDAQITDCGPSSDVVMTRIVVSPSGVVFSSETGAPVAGAAVELVNTADGSTAEVLNEDGTEPVANPQTTAENGEFSFPAVAPGTYRIEVTTPAGFTFASVVPVEQLPEGRSARPEASYGEPFAIADNPAPVAFDIPVDPDTEGNLFIEKTSSVESASIGDFVTYQIRVANNLPRALAQLRVEDILPFGFRYEEGTARLDGNAIEDPEGGKGPSLTFNIGQIEANSSVILTYRVLLGAGSRNGDATNTAVAISEDGLTKESNEAQNIIEVRGGVFTDKGYIIGKVFADCNENNVQDPGEAGVPGVRLYLENGNFVITDSRGKYTFYGINPNKHIVKVDNYSLPEGSKLGTLDNRHAGDPSSRFVDLKNGQMHRADFSICDCTPAVHNEIEKRREQYSSIGTDEIGAGVGRDINVDDNSRRATVKREQASGLIGGAEIPDAKRSGRSNTVASPSLAAGPQNAARPDTTVATTRTLEEAMIYEEAELGFIGLADGDTLHTAQTTIWAKSTLGATLQLSVNGQPVQDSRISKKSALSELSLQAYEYIGVDLKAGKNSITLAETDPFGNERGIKEITVFAPGQVDNINLSVPVNNVPADGASAAVVRVELQDESGVAVKTRVPVTLDVSIGKWLVKDVAPSTPGTQTYVEGGATDFELQSTLEPQDADVRVSIGVMDARTTVQFLPDLRPLIAAGIIEGTIRLNDGASIVPARSADGFERELRSFSTSSGDLTADARAAFFLKGKIKGNLLLTAGFDSEKDDDRLFRDIQPDEFYPVYGEASVKGYDAQSTGRLYVRVDHKRTYALFGDFITQERHPAKSLGEYNRTQTGLKFHYENNRTRLNVFGSEATSLQRVVDIRARGVSGPYNLGSDNILINSEQVEILTRDRNQPSVVLEREQLSRFRDYVVEPFTGNILFNRAIPSVDENLNPIFIRISFEVEDGADNYLIGGADGQFKVTDFWEVGGSFVEDRNPEDNLRLASANTSLRFGENTVLIGEVAQTDTETDGTGQGGRVELQHRGDVVDARLFAGQTDADFANPSAGLRQGRTEAGARGNVKVSSSTNLQGEFLFTRNDTLRDNTTGGVLNVQQRFTDDVRAEVGFRYAKQNNSALINPEPQNDITNKNIRGKLTLGVPGVEGASLFGEYEQDINESERKLIATGGDYRIKNIGRLYGRHEFISSAVGQFNLNGTERRQNTVFGIDAEYMQNGQVFSEYRVENAFDGRNAQAAIGLRNRFEIKEGFGINAGFERIFSLSGDPLNEGTAISTALDYTANSLWKGTARAEARFSRNGNFYLNTLGYGRKLSRDWTFLGKNIFNLQTSTNEGTPDRIQQRLRMGLAYRQTAQNRWDGLGRYELKYEENGQFGGNYNRLVHIFSTNVNYHPSSNWTHSGRLAAKKVGESSADFDSESLTMLLSARTIYDISRKLDGGINASMMSDAGFGAKDYGVGVELGYIVQRNLRLAVGFNVFGFEDRDLAASGHSRKGVYLGFSYKFDERLFKGLMPDEDKDNGVYATCDDCYMPFQAAELKQMPEQELAFAGLQPPTLKAPALEYTVQKEDSVTVKPRLLVTMPNNIHFASDKSLLSDASKEMLDRVAEFLGDQETFSLEITGHTDMRASYNYNLKLSERRAQSVQQYLVSKGVNADLVDFKGLSESSCFIKSEKDVIDRARNRRVKLNLNIPNINVRFIPQVNDLQVEKDLGKNMPEWDYLLNTQLKAVPDRIHLSGTQLSKMNKYMLDRLAMAMKHYPQETVTFTLTDPNKEERMQAITDYLQQTGLDLNRVKAELISRGVRGSFDDGMVLLNYGTNSELKPVTQRDDVALAGNKAVQALLDKLMELLKERQDNLLITENN